MAAAAITAGEVRHRAPRASDCYASLVCIICVEFEKGRMTAKEARRALGEMVPKVGAEHAEEVEHVVREAEAVAVVLAERERAEATATAATVAATATTGPAQAAAE